MMGRPGDLLGFPSWVADTLVDHVHLRYALLLVTLAWAALLARGRLLWALLPGVLFLDAVLGFWIASFGRPYGLLVDAETTRLAAETVAAALGGDEGPVSGEPLVLVPATLLARWGLPAGVVVALPTVLPLLVVPLIALVVSLLPRPRAEAALAGNLWLAFSTGQSEAIRGAGFLPGLWARPVAAVALVAVLAVVLAAGRLRTARLGFALGLLAVGAWALVPGAGPPLPFDKRLLVATVDQAPWVLLGGWGLARGAPGGAWALVAGGGLAFLLLPLVHPADTWGAAALCRIGLILASARPLSRVVGGLVEWLARGRSWVAGASRPESLGIAAVLLAAVPGSFAARWNPGALDPVAFASREPLSTNLAATFRWIREHVPPHSTCVASPRYAPMVAVLGQRRVLRAPSLAEPADDQRRRRTERMLLAGREPDLRRRYQVGCLVFIDGDQGWLGIASPDQLSVVPGLALRYADEHARVYVVDR